MNMRNIVAKTLGMITGDEPKEVLKMPKKGKFAFKKLTERELISRESEIGKTLFGPVTDGCSREFFNLDEKTWIWHEEYVDTAGMKRSMTTRYEVQAQGILKAQDGANYSYLEGEELQNFGYAIQMYYDRVMRGVYHRDPQTGQKLS